MYANIVPTAKEANFKLGTPYMPLSLQMKLIRKVIRLLALLGHSRKVAWRQLPVDETGPQMKIEARSRWWVSSRAYFDGRNIKDERIPRHLNRNNYFEVPSEMYREFEEQRRGYKKMMEKSDDMYEKMSRFMEDMRVGPVPQANKEPIIADQHYGISDLSGFQSNQGVASSFHTLPNSSSFFNMATPSNWQTPIPSNWQTPNPSYLGTPNSNPPIPSHPGTSNWQNPMTSYSLNLPPPIPSHRHDAGLLNRVTRDAHITMAEFILIREREENDNWTLSKSGTICLHPENNSFMILTDPHIIGTLDGSMRPYPSWKNVNWVYMPINAGGVHWVTGAINLTDSIFYVFDSMESESRMLMLEQQVRDWTPVINRILQMRGYFNGTGRQPHNFRFSYND
ncbi:phospholipase-like protein [Tanacetum coccineum]